MRHIVDKKELDGFKIERVVCSSFPKKLMFVCDPLTNFICFTVENEKEIIGAYGNIDDALEHYNSF